MPDKDVHDVIILGSGPAGLTAALYTARANFSPLVLEGIQPGGQLTITTDVENYPGFPEGVDGPGLVNLMKQQAERFGARTLLDPATAVDLGSTPFKVTTAAEDYRAKTLIIATGASARMLGLEGEDQYMGRGLSACATCDGFFYKEKEVLVIGGGDSAMEEAGFLTRFATKVTIVHRRDQLRASKIMQERARANEKINFLWNSVLEGFVGNAEAGITGATIRNVTDGSTSEVACDGIFYGLGHTPNTSIFADQIEIDEKGYIVTSKGTATNVPGVFAAGDVQDSRYRQAVTAAGSGCMAALDAEHYLEALG